MICIRKIVLTIISTVLVSSILTASEVPSYGNPSPTTEIPLSVRAAPYAYKAATVIGIGTGVVVGGYAGYNLWSRLPAELVVKIAQYSLTSGIVLSLFTGGVAAKRSIPSAELYLNALLKDDVSKPQLEIYKKNAQTVMKNVGETYLGFGCIGGVVGVVAAISSWFLF